MVAARCRRARRRERVAAERRRASRRPASRDSPRQGAADAERSTPKGPMESRRPAGAGPAGRRHREESPAQPLERLHADKPRDARNRTAESWDFRRQPSRQDAGSSLGPEKAHGGGSGWVWLHPKLLFGLPRNPLQARHSMHAAQRTLLGGRVLLQGAGQRIGDAKNGEPAGVSDGLDEGQGSARLRPRDLRCGGRAR